MGTMDETDMLQANARYLERENRSLRRKLRDEFAMAALPGFLASYEPVESINYVGSIARDCYKFADAMLKAREQ